MAESTTTTQREPRIAIVGAGVTGLLLAQALKKNGIQATVYDKLPSINHYSRDWTIMIHWALPLLRELLPPEVLDNLPSAYCVPTQGPDSPGECIPAFDGLRREGVPPQILFRLPTHNVRRVSRARLRRVLAQDVHVRWGVQVLDVQEPDDDGAMVIRIRRMEKGGDEKDEDDEEDESVSADLVIGADGPSSMIRQYLLGQEKARVVPSGCVVGIVSAVFDDAFKSRYVTSTHPLWTMVYHPDGLMAIGLEQMPDPDDPTSWVHTITRVWKAPTGQINMSGDEAIRHMQMKCESFSEPFRSAVMWVPMGSECHINTMTHWNPEPWDNRGGKMTLAGDAAHSMLPFRAQGLNCAIEDAHRLIDAILSARNGLVSWKEAISTYDDDAVKRGRAAVEMAHMESEKALKYTRILEGHIAKMGFAKGSDQNG